MAVDPRFIGSVIDPIPLSIIFLRVCFLREAVCDTMRVENLPEGILRVCDRIDNCSLDPTNSLHSKSTNSTCL